MANTKQSEKRARQNGVRRSRGQDFRSRCRTMIKKVRAVAATGETKKFSSIYSAMQSVVDRTVGKKLLRRNTASRIKRRLNRVLLSQSAESASTQSAESAKS